MIKPFNLMEGEGGQLFEIAQGHLTPEEFADAREAEEDLVAVTPEGVLHAWGWWEDGGICWTNEKEEAPKGAEPVTVCVVG